MQSKQDEKLNRLLGRQGSIAEQTHIAKGLDDDRFQIAAPYSVEAREELERRKAERALHKRWYERPAGITILSIIATIIASLVVAFILLYFGLK